LVKYRLKKTMFGLLVLVVVDNVQNKRELRLTNFGRKKTFTFIMFFNNYNLADAHRDAI
jgi:hypothetical protein